jgi:HAMP domain-containing protein
MKNLSIRWRILGGIVLIQLIGAIVVVIYLHQSYSKTLDVQAARQLTVSASGWNQITDLGKDEMGSPTGPKAAEYVDRLKKITGADYGILVDKSSLKADQYAASREAQKLPNNWDERENYVLVAATDQTIAEEMQFKAPSDSVPEIGKLVGIENGSCSKTCHGSMTASGDYWTVRWSKDNQSRAHSVFPLSDESGKPIGIVYSIDNITESANHARALLISTLLVIGATLLVATLVIGGMLDTLVFKRLSKMIASMEELGTRVAGGDFSARFTPDDSVDEIGEFERFFARFMDLVTGTLRSLTER